MTQQSVLCRVGPEKPPILGLEVDAACCYNLIAAGAKGLTLRTGNAARALDGPPIDGVDVYPSNGA